MEKIETKTVYLPVNNSEVKTHTAAVTVFDGREESVAIEKHSNMVVLTKGDTCAKIIDAMVVAYRMGLCNEPGDSFKTKCGEYLTQLFGEGKIN
jgi:hypothetical protein